MKHDFSKCYADLHHLHIVETIHACIASQVFFVEKQGNPMALVRFNAHEPGAEVQIVSSQKASLLPVQLLSCVEKAMPGVNMSCDKGKPMKSWELVSVQTKDPLQSS